MEKEQAMTTKITPADINAFVAEMQDYPLISTRAHAVKEFKGAIRREKAQMKRYGEPQFLDCAKIAANIRANIEWGKTYNAKLEAEFGPRDISPKQKVINAMCTRAKLIEARLWEAEARKRGQL